MEGVDHDKRVSRGLVEAWIWTASADPASRGDGISAESLGDGKTF